MKLSRLPLLLLLLSYAMACAGCPSNDQRASEEGRRITNVPRVTENKSKGIRTKRQSFFDRGGALLPSGTRVVGLELPMGLREVRQVEREHVFHTDVPVEKLEAYFLARVTPTEVARVGRGVILRRASPKGVRGAVVPLDIRILPRSPRGVRVDLTELPPVPTKRLNEGQIRQILIEEQRRAE